MIGIQNAGELPEVVEREITNLISRLRKLFTQQHSAKGEHLGASYSGTIAGITRITIVDGIITEVS